MEEDLSEFCSLENKALAMEKSVGDLESKIDHITLTNQKKGKSAKFEWLWKKKFKSVDAFQ